MIIDCFTTHDNLEISVDGALVRFEFSARFGPWLLGKRGDLISKKPSRRFLERVSWWWQQGGQVVDGVAQYVAPVKAPLYHLGGSDYTECPKMATKFGGVLVTKVLR